MNEKNEIRKFIMEHIDKEECDYMCDDEVFDCCACSNFEICRMTAEMRRDDEFAKSMDYGGYNTEEDFWEQM